MTTPVNRRTTPVNPCSQHPSQFSLERVWLYVVAGVGIGSVALILVACFALDLFGSRPNTRTATLITAESNSSVNLQSVRVPEPEVHTDRHAQPFNFQKNEEITVAAPAPVDDEESPSKLMPKPETPAVAGKGPERPHKTFSENDLRVQRYRAPEVGLKSSSRDKLVEVYKTSYQSNASMGRRPVFDASLLIKHVASAQELPLRSFPNCQLNPVNARTLGVLSRSLHVY